MKNITQKNFWIMTLIIVVLFAIAIYLTQFKMAQAATVLKTYTQRELLKMADNKYGDGMLPLGDKKYTTDIAKKGNIFLCHVNNNPPEGGAQVAGSWINEEKKTWNKKLKIAVQGNVAWENAYFSNTAKGEKREINSNGLPFDHNTGTFPISSSDPAYKVDRNPNTISAQNIKLTLSKNPKLLDTPACIDGEVGIMNNGPMLFNGFDALYRDAVAREVQDSCSGHPERTGQYHYHGINPCFKTTSVKKVVGYALDGFPITGGMVAKNKYLTTEDLDECHGISSEIFDENGKKITAYHYVMTEDYPYSVSCFRGTPYRAQKTEGKVGGARRGSNSGGPEGGIPSLQFKNLPQGGGVNAS